jgi:hypothetical protein
MADFLEPKLNISSYHLPRLLCEPYDDKIYTIRKMLNTNATDINIMLHIAARNGEEDAIKMLHECGANMEEAMLDDKIPETPQTGWTPICYAAFYGQVDAIEMLHECGADVNKEDAEGRTPVSIAALKGHVDVIKVLHKCGANVITSESIALYKKYSQDINKLKECGLSDDVVTKKQLEEEENLYMKYVKDRKFKFLTRKYLTTILERIELMTSQGNSETYMNFNRDDFKANCNGLGFPSQFQRKWLMEMQNPKSAYLPTLADGSKPSLEGIRFDVWGNRKFTTHFKWDLKKN